MKPQTMEKLVWVLLYGGIILATLGYFVARTDENAGLLMQACGGVAVAGGVLLIWLRSRIRGQ
ncbi:hypothetical protein [Aquincola sp. J276]|uniref:hypothetical protein n=1 Tax=Aquincola sp. J276 TaxID=2898432 RepID=UPI0021517D0B|nr:hypothetical protein [Aquincola sp. J276]MCR5865105.1 hypothetical protein [Aquincola sp. J276]